MFHMAPGILPKKIYPCLPSPRYQLPATLNKKCRPLGPCGGAMLNVETYDAAESAAAERFSNRILQAFYPEMFATLGYPARARHEDQLRRYIDVMHETRTQFNMEHLLYGLTEDEFELFKQITRLVDKHATQQFGIRAHPTAALLRAIHALRIIKIVTGPERPVVLEVGPGCGYLAMLLLMEGYPYVGTDVVQAFYLYQNRMLSLAASNLVELAVDDGDILTIESPRAGTAIHIPWWKWVTLTPDSVKLSAGIMTCNHVLCEMHSHSLAYLARMARRILSNHPGGGKIVFENWGYNLLHSHESVSNKFAEYGLRLCHDEYAMSALVLAEEVEAWAGQQQQPSAVVQDTTSKPWVDHWPRLRRHVGAVLHHFPTLKRAAVMAVQGMSQIRQPESLPVVKSPSGVYPLSRQLTVGHKEVLDRATIQLPELRAFLQTHFGGEPPRLQDDVFLDLIGVRF